MMKRIPAQQRDKFIARHRALEVSIVDFLADFKEGMGLPRGEGPLFETMITDMIERLTSMKAALKVQER